LWAFDVVVGPNSWSAPTPSHSDDISARPFTHAGGGQRYCGENENVSSMIPLQTAEVDYMKDRHEKGKRFG
jgi:hypothetical protein